jgi:hypothetical protein
MPGSIETTTGCFRLSILDAEAIVDVVKAVVATWRERAKRMGIADSEIDRMGRAFNPG